MVCPGMRVPLFLEKCHLSIFFYLRNNAGSNSSPRTIRCITVIVLLAKIARGPKKKPKHICIIYSEHRFLMDRSGSVNAHGPVRNDQAVEGNGRELGLRKAPWGGQKVIELDVCKCRAHGSPCLSWPTEGLKGILLPNPTPLEKKTIYTKSKILDPLNSLLLLWELRLDSNSLLLIYLGI